MVVFLTMCSLHLRLHLQRNLWTRKQNKKAFHKSRFFGTALNLHLLLSRGGFLLYVGMIPHGHTHTLSHRLAGFRKQAGAQQ